MFKIISNLKFSFYLIPSGINFDCFLKKTFCSFLFLIILNFAFAQKQNLTSYPEVTPYSISLKNADHNSDGFLVTLSSGRIIHFFRIDPGQAGGHIGNSGKIAKRYSDDDGFTWSVAEDIYNDQWDNRNIHGGIIGTDTITLTFRSYDAFANSHKGYYIMYSFDAGSTWTTPTLVTTEGKASGTNQIFKIPHRGYYHSIYDMNYLELRYSPDGLNWDSIVNVWDYRTSHLFITSEACFTSLGNDTIIGLIRNDAIVLGQTFLQVVSTDAGVTWSQPTITNIADSLFCPSPWLFYDSTNNDIWVIATDRRGEIGSPFTHFEEKIWIYKNSPDQIINNSLSYNLFDSVLRPFPNTKRFYGYPVSTKKANGNYLVLFIESEYRGSNGEWAYFYQFNINYGPDNISQIFFNNNESFLLYPNPTLENITIEINNRVIPSYSGNITIVSAIGKTMFSENINSLQNNKYVVNCMNFSAGLYNCIISIDGKNYSKTFLKSK